MKDATLAGAREDDGDMLAKAKDDWTTAGTAGFDGRSVVGVRHLDWLLVLAGHSGWPHWEDPTGDRKLTGSANWQLLDRNPGRGTSGSSS